MAGSIIDPDRAQMLVRRVIEHGESFAQKLMAAKYKNGHSFSEVPEEDPKKEMAQLMLDHDYLLDVASRKIEGLDGNAIRAQQMLQREQELREMLNATSATQT